MKTRLLPFALVAALLAGACGGDDDDTTGPDNDGVIQLSSAQATAIKNRIVQLAPTHPDLAWLADTIRLVVGEGVEVTEVPVTTSLGDGPFYAVALQRTITTSTSASSAFDIIMFNDPSNPTDFIIVSGWVNPGNNPTPLTTLTGSFGSPTSISTMNAHFLHVSGSTVSSWRATGGSATFTGGTSSGTCSTLSNTSTVTCQLADLTAAFNVTATTPDNQTSSGTQTGSLATTDVGGIIIRMQIQ